MLNTLNCHMLSASQELIDYVLVLHMLVNSVSKNLIFIEVFSLHQREGELPFESSKAQDFVSESACSSVSMVPTFDKGSLPCLVKVSLVILLHILFYN